MCRDPFVLDGRSRWKNWSGEALHSGAGDEWRKVERTKSLPVFPKERQTIKDRFYIAGSSLLSWHPCCRIRDENGLEIRCCKVVIRYTASQYGCGKNMDKSCPWVPRATKDVAFWSDFCFHVAMSRHRSHSFFCWRHKQQHYDDCHLRQLARNSMDSDVSDRSTVSDDRSAVPNPPCYCRPTVFHRFIRSE